MLQFLQCAMMGDLTRDELAVIEPFRVGEQQLQFSYDDMLAEAVDGRPVFLLLIFDDTEQLFFLVRGEV